MGGIVIRVETDKQAKSIYQFNAQSLDVANFMSLSGIETINGVGDSYNGTIIFDVEKKILTINSDYFKLPDSAFLFWRALGFIVVANKKASVNHKNSEEAKE